MIRVDAFQGGRCESRVETVGESEQVERSMAKSSGTPAPRGSRGPAKEVDSGDSSGASAPFDFDRLQQLMELMEKHGLNEISLRCGDEHWRLRRGVPTPTVISAPAPVASTVVAAAPSAAPAVAPAATPASVDDGLLQIRSPTVGTYYSAQSPEDPPFVSVGTKVSPATTVCLIEAMKVFNPIAAEISGTIEAVLVKNGDPVEFGQPLFKVRP